MEKEIKKVADQLLAKGEKVFVNEKDELFTSENLAKLSGSKYSEYKGSKSADTGKYEETGASGKNAKKPFNKMNATELKAECAEREINIPDGSTNADMVKLIEDDVAAKEATGGDQ